jgi:hypothetical protein
MVRRRQHVEADGKPTPVLLPNVRGKGTLGSATKSD